MGITIDKVRDLNGATDNVNLSDGTDSLDINADGSINVTISGQSNVYAEDSVHTSGDDGNFILTVRSDTKASTAGTDGDYAGLITDADGDLYVSDTVAQGSLATLAGAVAGTEMQVDVITMPGTQIEDTASAGGETLLMVGGYRQDADTSPVSADGDFHGFIFNELGQLKVAAQLDQTSNSSFVVTTTTVNTTVGGTQLISSALAGRRELTIQNLGNEEIWIKNGTGVTAGAAGNGFLLPRDSSASYMWGANLDPYAITASGSSDVKCIESA